MTVRTRFAPSPTGRLHLGNLRIAVFNWLFARRHQGVFILRLEDTDLERNLPGAEEGIIQDLRWLGLTWDEGPGADGPKGPYRQSERTHVYRAAAERLLARGRAYRCWCTEQELSEERERVGGGEVLRYSGRCRRLSREEHERNQAEGRPFVVRFAVAEGPESVDVRDEVRGLISFPRHDVTDFVILRSDGRPTYNFAVVADDVDMEISHVIRGVGHLSNTPRQALLCDALEVARPLFAHLPTVLAPGGGKLSKRLGAAGAGELRARGYHPDGVVNYLSLLGWSSPDEREVLSREELIAGVSLERVGRSDTAYDPEKLRWLSGQHIARMGTDDLVAALLPFLERARFPLEGEALSLAVETIRTRLSTFAEIDEQLRWFFPEDSPELREARREVRTDPQGRRVLESIAERIRVLEPWTPGTVRAALRETGKALGVGGPALFHPVRRAMMGVESGPDLGGVMSAIGRAEVLARIDRTLDGHGV